jgi:hypothetical protein
MLYTGSLDLEHQIISSPYEHNNNNNNNNSDIIIAENSLSGCVITNFIRRTLKYHKA